MIEGTVSKAFGKGFVGFVLNGADADFTALGNKSLNGCRMHNARNILDFPRTPSFSPNPVEYAVQIMMASYKLS